MADGDDSSITSSSGPLTDSADLKPNLDEEIKRSDLEKSLELHKQSMQLRRIYARWVLILAILQIVLINAYFVLDSLGVVPWTCLLFKPSQDVFKVFTISVFAEVIALAVIVTQSLFPGEGGFWSSLLGLFGKKAA